MNDSVPWEKLSVLRHRWARRAQPLIAFSLLMGLAVVHGQSQPLREYDVKAAFLFNFLSFVEWPEQSFESPDAPFVIGVFAHENPFGNALEAIVADETVKQHPVQVRYLDRLDEVPACDMVFIARSEQYRVRRVLEATRGRAILTVADMPGFTEEGGMIELRNIDQRVRLKINRQNAFSSGLTINSKLLSLAQVVGEQPVP